MKPYTESNREGRQRRLTLKELPPEERPRERLLEKGAAALTDAELLAIIIRDGTPSESAVDLARRLMKNSDNELRRLREKSITELCELKGIGPARAAQIKAALELATRLGKKTLQRGRRFTGSKDVFEHFYHRLRNKKQECFLCVLLDIKNRVVRVLDISEGGLNSAIVNPGDVLRPALVESATGIIVVHNHPSGDPEPSADDIHLTQRLKKIVEMAGMRLLDHVIIGEEGYISLADEGKM